jgi:glycosyltransferase involved in cell wall biosynthesis
VTDDWISFDQPLALRERTRAQDAALCQRADATIVCSQRLYEMKLPLAGAGRVHLIPNGVDATHYERVLDSMDPLPAMSAKWSRPVFGYTGTVHADRVDVDLVEQLARKLQAGSIVLVGPNHLSEAQNDRLSSTGRVFITGPVRYREVPEVMRAFDVCIVPHRITAFTESLNPIKLWEYLAAGKPIVSTNIAGFRDYPQFVVLADDAAEFHAGMHEALAEPIDRQGQRRAEAKRHSWGVRVNAIEAIIDSVVGNEGDAVA